MLGGRIGLWVLGTVIMAGLNNSGLLLKGFQAVCTVIGMGADPEMRRKATEILTKAETKVGEAANPPQAETQITAQTTSSEPYEPPERKLTLKEKLNDKFVDPAKKTIEKNAKKLEDKADTAKEELKTTANDVADKLGAKLPQGGMPTLPQGGTPPAFPGQPRDPGQQTSGVIHDMGNMASGAVQGPSGEIAKIVAGREAERKAAVAGREARLAPIREDYNIWWAQFGPNGRCPKCKTVMTVSRAGHGNTKCHNPRCGFRSHADEVRSIGPPPPMPVEPPPVFYVWKKAKEEAAARAEKAKAANEPAKEPAKERS